jgi:hypothetical protein
MADYDRWDSAQTIVMIQKGGAGNKPQIMSQTRTVTGHSGGGQSVRDMFARDYTKGGGAYRRQGVAVDSDPERYTFDIMTRLSIQKLIEDMSRMKCVHTLWIRETCGQYNDFTDYLGMMGYEGVYGVGQTLSENLANGTTLTSPDLMVTVNESASEVMPVKKVNHLDVSGTEVDVAINAIISIGAETCGCGCGTEDSGVFDYLAVTDQDASPGYQGNPAPYLGWSQESAVGEIDWTWVSIEDFLDGDAIDVLYSGGYVLVVSATNGVAYARYSDLVAGVATPFSLATGFTANFPNAIADSGSAIWAVGDGGYIWKSTDGGQSFTEVSAGTYTTENLNDVVFASDVFGWFVGDSGTVLTYQNGAISVVTVTDTVEGALTANVNKVAVPQGRQCEAYLAAGGEIWRTRDKGSNWEYMEFLGHGTGTVESIKFSGPNGHMFWVVQTNVAGTKSRVLRDYSGGALAYVVDVVGSWDSPANSVINDIAPANLNYAASGGEVDGGYAFIGRIIPAP